MAKKILLADDSITIQKVVELTFSDGDYEVTAVNNGAKAIQKLSEMRPDIILSDIIMPEKNGYEVCEYVKSHPEYRHIPVILLTGTFEPFDPDRADKAGCDAVVTKPFESQSLIHKVEELIQHSQSSAAAEPEPQAAPALFADVPSFADTPSFDPPPQAEPADPFAHDNDIFAAAPSPSAAQSTDMPFEAPESSFGNETRAMPRMSFEEMQQMASAASPAAASPAPPPPPAHEASPWDEPAAFGGETRAFPRMSFEEMQQMASASQPAAVPHQEAPSPFDAAPAPAVQEESPWDEPKEDTSTRAFPTMSFDEMRKMAEQAPAPAPAETAPEVSPWDEAPSAFGGETRAFPRMSFEEMEKMAANPAAAAPEPEWATPEPEWATPEAAVPTADPFAEPTREDVSPFALETEETPATEEPEWSAPEPLVSQHAAAEPEVNAQITDSSQQSASLPAELSDEHIDRIARRVVQLLSDRVIRDIAWEVIPELAEIAVKERIRQLEAEA